MSITYIAQLDGPESLIKFGKTTKPKARLSTLNTGTPWPIKLVAMIGSDVERDLKKRFAEDKVRGEWFRPTQRLQDYLDELADAGKLVKQVPVDQAYINAVIKPRIKEYLNGREATNSSYGDLVRCIFADVLPTLDGREKDLVTATKGHVTDALARGFGPCPDRVTILIPTVEAARLVS